MWRGYAQNVAFFGTMSCADLLKFSCHCSTGFLDTNRPAISAHRIYIYIGNMTYLSYNIMVCRFTGIHCFTHLQLRLKAGFASILSLLYLADARVSISEQKVTFILVEAPLASNAIRFCLAHVAYQRYSIDPMAGGFPGKGCRIPKVYTVDGRNPAGQLQ